MANSLHLTVRIPEAEGAVIEELAQALQGQPEFLGVRISRQLVLRRALLMGLDQMAEDYLPRPVSEAR